MTFTVSTPDGFVDIVEKVGDVTYGDILIDAEGNKFVPQKQGYGAIPLEVAEAVAELVEDVTDAVGDVVDEVKDVVNDVREGIEDAVEDVKDAFTGDDESPAEDGPATGEVDSSEEGGAEA